MLCFQCWPVRLLPCQLPGLQLGRAGRPAAAGPRRAPAYGPRLPSQRRLRAGRVRPAAVLHPARHDEIPRQGGTPGMLTLPLASTSHSYTHTGPGTVGRCLRLGAGARPAAGAHAHLQALQAVRAVSGGDTLQQAGLGGGGRPPRPAKQEQHPRPRMQVRLNKHFHS